MSLFLKSLEWGKNDKIHIVATHTCDLFILLWGTKPKIADINCPVLILNLGSVLKQPTSSLLVNTVVFAV